MTVQYTRPGRVGVEGPIKGVMGRRAQAKKPKPAPGAAARTRGGRSPSPARTRTGPGRDAAALIPAAPAHHDRPWTRPRSPDAAMTGGGPVVQASPTGLLSRSGPGGSPGGPERRTAQPLTRQEREGYPGFFLGVCLSQYPTLDKKDETFQFRVRSQRT